MQAIREIIHPNRKKITFSIPEEYVGHDLELVILPLAFPRDKRRSGVPGNYDFTDMTGKLKWRGNAVLEQRRLRDEWE
jgi:hypothetical protein